MIEPSRSYRQCPEWKQAMELSVYVFHQSSALDDEHRVLIEELQKVSMRIAGYIAEGHDEEDGVYFRRFLKRARGASFRLATVAELCEQLDLPGDWNGVIVGVTDLRRNLDSLIMRLRELE